MCKLYKGFFYVVILQSSLLISASIEKPESIVMETLYFQVPKVASQMIVDGKLNEPLWQKAVKVEANIEVQPGENIDAPVMTEALIAYTDEFIYVAITAFDPEPEKILARYCDRDEIWEDDWVLILFDPFNDQRRTYDFVCNPFGIQADMIETPTGGGDSWDTIWESDGQITEDGFVVEMAIPFSSLGFPRQSGDQTWGFDVVRSYPRSVRHHIGSFARDRNNNCYMCQSHKLVGFDGATPGKNIEFDPTVSAIYTQEREDEMTGPFQEKEKKMETGLTMKWGVTPNLMLNSTLNPDFSNVEADILQLDINNQFAIYYPEKRPFFLEGADFFESPFDLIHTRSLANPNYGVKLTGKEGPHGIGFFTVEDDVTNYLFPGAEGSDSDVVNKKSYGSVLRYKRDISKSSNMGIMITDREGDSYHNRLAAMDADFKFTSTDRIRFQVGGSQTQYPDSFKTAYDQPGGEFTGNVFKGYYIHDTEHWEAYVFHQRLDSDFRADLGFISQVGTRYNEIAGQYRWRAEADHWYTWLSVFSSYFIEQDEMDNTLHRANAFQINYEGPKRSHGHVYAEYGEAMYDGKTYRKNWIQGCAGYYMTPEFFVHLYWKYGDQIDYDNHRPGTRYLLEPYLEWRWGLHFSTEFDHIYEQLYVDPGRLYTANISRLKLIYQFNKRLFFRSIIQYKDYDRNVALYEDDDVDARTKKIFTQFLLSYKINPQTVFFLGYSDDSKGDHETSLTQTNRTIFAKVGYAYRL